MTSATTASAGSAAMPAVRPADPAPPPAGLDREDWVALLARLTRAFATAADRGGSPARAQLPGAPAGAVDPSMEGFARMSVAWGAWLGLASNPRSLGDGDGTVDVGDLMVRGLVDGTSDGAFGWGPMRGRDQRIVEAAELVTGLWLGRERLVPLLGPERLAQVTRWLSQVHGLEVYDDNWYLFPVIVATVRRGLGERVPDRLIDEGLDRVHAWYRGDGWYADGPGHAYDSYTGWAIHWHQLLWASIDGARRPRLRKIVIERARTFLASTAAFVAADGSRILQGRSLGYRFADAAPFALAELLGFGAVPPGLARRLASVRIQHHLDAGALDPETGWFRRGIGAERPSVLERYISAGSSAWAGHAFVSLGLPPEAPFWAAPAEPLPVERGDGSLVLRGPGFLVGWRRSTGATWLGSSIAGHPSDIPGHDYNPYYGKLAYRSGFPASIRAAAGGPTSDDGILVVATGHGGQRIEAVRGETAAGAAGPGWTWSRYEISAAGRHRFTTVVLPWRSVEVRVTGIVPEGPVQLIEGSASLGTDTPEQIERFGSPAGRWQAARTDRRFVAIRALAGYAEAHPSRPTGEGTDLNLVADHAENPTVAEASASPKRRVVASVASAVASADGPVDELEAIELGPVDADPLRVVLGAEEVALVALRSPLPDLDADGRRVTGRLRVLRWRVDGSIWAGEAVAEIDGVIRLDAPGPVRVARQPEGQIEVCAMDGFEIDPGWAGRRDASWRLEVLDAAGWRDAGPPDRVVGVSRRAIRRLQRRLGLQLVTLRLSPEVVGASETAGRNERASSADAR